MQQIKEGNISVDFNIIEGQESLVSTVILKFLVVKLQGVPINMGIQ